MIDGLVRRMQMQQKQKENKPTKKFKANFLSFPKTLFQQQLDQIAKLQGAINCTFFSAWALNSL